MSISKAGGRRVPEVVRQVAAVEVGRQTIEVDDPGARTGGQTLPRRTARLSGELISLLFPDATTLPHSFRGAVDSKPNHPALSTRVWTGGRWGPYEHVSYSALAARVDNFGSGLHSLGLRPGDVVGLWAENGIEWVVAALAAFAHSLVVVPIRPDVSHKTARYILNHSKAKAIVCSHSTLTGVAEMIKKCKKVAHTVVIPRHERAKDGGEEDGLEMEARDVKDLGKCSLYSFSELETRGTQKRGKAIIPDASSPAVIAYTQGATGSPKGVELSHAALVAAQAGLVPVLEGSGDWPVDTDVFYAHTTFASMFHFTLLFTLLACGATVGMPSAGDANLAADVEKLRPTVFAGTPEVFQRLYTRLMQVVAQSNSLKKWMFKKGYSAKHRRIGPDGSGGGSVWDGLVFNNIRACMGGRLRLVLSSDYPLPPNTRHFLQICFGCAVIEVYTLTEAAGIVCATSPSDPASLHVGSPIASLEVKLLDESKLGFSTSAKQPSGEICIRGMSVAQHYVDDEELTSAVFDEEGWVHTGDIGTWNDNGTLTLVDRKENIVQLQGGEFVALGKLESLYARSQFVQQIYVHGDDTEPCVVAVVLVHPSVVRSFATNPAVRHQFQGQSDPSELINNPTMRNVVVSDLRTIGKSLGVRSCELVRAVHLEIGEWTVDDGLVTPTQRLHRDALLTKYRKKIAGLYDELKRRAREAVEGEEGTPSSSRVDRAPSLVQFNDVAAAASSASTSSLDDSEE